jgi:hypothetical protein
MRNPKHGQRTIASRTQLAPRRRVVAQKPLTFGIVQRRRARVRPNVFAEANPASPSSNCDDNDFSGREDPGLATSDRLPLSFLLSLKQRRVAGLLTLRALPTQWECCTQRPIKAGPPAHPSESVEASHIKTITRLDSLILSQCLRTLPTPYAAVKVNGIPPSNCVLFQFILVSARISFACADGVWSPAAILIDTGRGTYMGYGNDSRQTWPHRRNCLILKRLRPDPFCGIGHRLKTLGQ